jgi:hypothetical protein
MSSTRFTVIAFHTSAPSVQWPDEASWTLAELEDALKANHGVLPFGIQSMTLRDQAGNDVRSWFSWRASARRYGTDFHVQSAAGVEMHTIKMPGFWYAGTAP